VPTIEAWGNEVTSFPEKSRKNPGGSQLRRNGNGKNGFPTLFLEVK